MQKEMKRNKIFSDKTTFESMKFFPLKKPPTKTNSTSEIFETTFQPSRSQAPAGRSYNKTSLELSKAFSDIDSLPESSIKLTKHKRCKSVSWCDEHSNRDDPIKQELCSMERDKVCATAKSSANLDQDIHYKIKVDLSQSKYEIVRRIALQMHFTIVLDSDLSNLIWIDDHVSMEMVSQLSSSQRINHFPSMEDIAKKHLLAQEMTKISKINPHEFSFYPKSWLWPDQKKELEGFCKKLSSEKRKILFISRSILPNKRPARVFSSDEFNRDGGHSWSERMLVQEHVEPLTIEGRGLRIRSYAIVTSLSPIRIFIFKDLLASIEADEDKRNRNVPGKPHKNKFSADGLSKLLSSRTFNLKHFWKNVENVVFKTILLCHPKVSECYEVCRSRRINGGDSVVCFELLAFDLLLDANNKIWLMAVKQSPNLKVEDDVDLLVKGNLIHSLFQLIRYDLSKKKAKFCSKTGQSSLVDFERPEGNSKKQKLTKITEDILRPINGDDGPNFETNDMKLIFPPKTDENSRRLWVDILETIYSMWEESRPAKDLELLSKRSRFLSTQMKMKLRADKKKKEEEETKLVEISNGSLQHLLENLKSFKIPIPGSTDVESKKHLEKVRQNWEIYEKDIRCFWFEKLVGRKQRNIMEMAMKSLEQVMTNSSISEPRRTNVFRISSRVFNRLGRSLWDSFHSNRCWEKFIKDSRMDASFEELECFRETLRICLDCLLVVYLCSEGNHRGSAPTH